MPDAAADPTADAAADSTADTTAPTPDLRSMWSLVRWWLHRAKCLRPERAAHSVRLLPALLLQWGPPCQPGVWEHSVPPNSGADHLGPNHFSSHHFGPDDPAPDHLGSHHFRADR